MLTAKNLGKTYKGKKIVKDFTVELNSDEVVGLLGPNGAGKTTAFYMMVGLIKPDYGQIYLDTKEITDLPMYMRARKGIGYLPQEPSIFKGLTVEENIMCILELIEPNLDLREEKVAQLLEEFSIDHLRGTLAIALSGGERRRVEIARCLASNPKYIMSDEPFAGVDPISINEIKELIIFLKKRGTGVLITDHNVKEAISLMDRVYVMYNGTILESGATKKVINSPEVKKLYLGDKFTYENFS
ncbi:MAG: LPS export ABC transporter ATP-binding protein [Candidatus Midichloria sp.]|nr:MAG: LPS export ABC transporter ATP-binding protein [Candidatus Midichloria sp.]